MPEIGVVAAAGAAGAILGRTIRLRDLGRILGVLERVAALKATSKSEKKSG